MEALPFLSLSLSLSPSLSLSYSLSLSLSLVEETRNAAKFNGWRIYWLARAETTTFLWEFWSKDDTLLLENKICCLSPNHQVWKQIRFFFKMLSPQIFLFLRSRFAFFCFGKEREKKVLHSYFPLRASLSLGRARASCSRDEHIKKGENKSCKKEKNRNIFSSPQSGFMEKDGGASHE